MIEKTLKKKKKKALKQQFMDISMEFYLSQ